MPGNDVKQKNCRGIAGIKAQSSKSSDRSIPRNEIFGRQSSGGEDIYQQKIRAICRETEIKQKVPECFNETRMASKLFEARTGK